MSSVYDVERDIMQRIRTSDRTKQKVFPITFVPEDVAYVASVYPLNAFDFQSQYGPMLMPPCEHPARDVMRDPQKYPPALLQVQGAFLPMDEGDDKIKPSYTPARDRAEDLARRFAQFGVFVPANPKQITREEVKEAVAKLEVLYREWISANDQVWRDHGTLVKHGVSTGWIAAKHFGIDRDWAERAGELGTCRFCQKSVKANIVKCPHCGSILDWKMAYEGGQVSKEQALEHGVKLP